jgi:hypothetical protein
MKESYKILTNFANLLSWNEIYFTKQGEGFGYSDKKKHANKRAA